MIDDLLRHTVGPGHRPACSESCSSFSEWETDNESLVAADSHLWVAGGGASAPASPEPTACGGSAPSHPPRDELRELERSFAEDSRRLHERFHAAHGAVPNGTDDALADEEAMAQVFDAHVGIPSVRPADDTTDDELGRSLPAVSEDGALEREGAARDGATPSPELVSNSEFTGADRLGAPDLDSPDAPIAGVSPATSGGDHVAADVAASFGRAAAPAAAVVGGGDASIWAAGGGDIGGDMARSLAASTHSARSAAASSEALVPPSLVQSAVLPLCARARRATASPPPPLKH
eukprot:7383946-Prymnesium_polylepis.2